MSADIGAGRLTGLVGPDGAGKTTLIRMIAALMTPTEGSIRVTAATSSSSRTRSTSNTGYMPQRFGLYEELSVIENLRLYAKLRARAKGAALEETFAQLLHFTRLEPFVDRRAGKLSGGMKQKLGLACALMAKPEVLLLDEPSAGVDPVSRRELLAMVAALTHDGMAVVWSTAYLDEAERCDAVLLLKDGRVEFDGRAGRVDPPCGGPKLPPRGMRERTPQRADDDARARRVRDGVIHGDAMRVVLKDGASIAQLDPIAQGNGIVSSRPAALRGCIRGSTRRRTGRHSSIAAMMDPAGPRHRRRGCAAGT